MSRPQPRYTPGEELTDEEKIEATAEAQRLVEGWYQTSRKHRMIARLPEGKTGIQALIDAENAGEHPHTDLESWANGMGEAHAGDHFLGVHADRLSSRFPDEYVNLSMTLDPFTFNEWRRLGGETYMSRHWKIRLSEDEARDVFRLAMAWRKERFPVEGLPITGVVLPDEQVLCDLVMKLEEKYAHAIEGSHI